MTQNEEEGAGVGGVKEVHTVEPNTLIPRTGGEWKGPHNGSQRSGLGDKMSQFPKTRHTEGGTELGEGREE